MSNSDIDLSQIKSIHLIAICGTGMGALAGILKTAGYQVTGSDQNVYPPMSTQLETLGIPIMKGYAANHLDHNPDLVIIGNAIRRENPEAQAALKSGTPYLSFPGALHRFFLADRRTTAVCGTHGKTTTTALLAHLFMDAGQDPSFLVGGVLKNIGSGFRIGEGCDFIIEGDEYDTAFFDKVPKFIRYMPVWAIVANIEFDHADIYDDLAQIKVVFSDLIKSIPAEGTLFAGIDSPDVRDLYKMGQSEIITFGIDPEADYAPGNWNITHGVMAFEVIEKGTLLGKFECSLAGEHNLKNILAAVAVCRKAGIDADAIAKGLGTFQGIKRRQEIRGEKSGVTVVDDFAHHPTAVEQTLNALRKTYPTKRIVAVFEPRTNTSRRNFFQSRYVEAFKAADAVFIAPVFDLDSIAPDQRFDPCKLVEDLCAQSVHAIYAQSSESLLLALVEFAKANDLMVIMSNGGFGGIHEKLLASL